MTDRARLNGQKVLLTNDQRFQGLIMPFQMSRRSFLSGSAKFAALGYGASLAPLTLGRAMAASTTTLEIDRRTIEVNGKAASVFGIRQPDGVQGIRLEPDEPFRVDLINRTDEPTIIHWHGQVPPYLQDGVSDRSVALLGPGAKRRYNYEPVPGTHWMHSHFGLQEQALLAAPLVVRSAEDARADLQEVTVLLHDFSFTPPSELLAALVGGSFSGGHKMEGMVGMQGMDHTGMAMDLNDVGYDAFLANDRTLNDPLVVQVERRGRVRLRLINGASSSAFWIDLGTLKGTVVAVDGVPVEPVSGSSFPMAIAQRLDVIVEIDGDGTYPIFAQLEGGRERTGVILATPGSRIERLSDIGANIAPPVDLSLEEKLRASIPLEGRPIDQIVKMDLTGEMSPYSWSINRSHWPDVERPHIRRGQRVMIELQNRTMMAHPMHLHGHRFQVVAINGNEFPGAVRDTVLVPPMANVRIAFDADNPGRWPFHCHNLYHMAAGMMTEFVYDTFV